MMDFDGYTPEMLIYFHAMPPQLQSKVQGAPQPPQSMESLAALAEQYAQAGFAAVPTDAAQDLLPQ